MTIEESTSPEGLKTDLESSGGEISGDLDLHASLGLNARASGHHRSSSVEENIRKSTLLMFF